MCLRTLHMASFDLLIDPMLLLSPAVHILPLRKMQACKLKMWRKDGIAGQWQSVTNASGKGAANRHLFSTTILSPFIAVGLLTTKICSALSLQGSGPLFALFYTHTHFCVSATLVCVADRKPGDNTQHLAPFLCVLFLWDGVSRWVQS